MDQLKALWSWLITSSADPAATSRTAVGALTFFSGYLLQALQIACTAGLACLPIDNAVTEHAISAIGSGLEGLLMALGAIIALLGILRKIQNKRWAAPQG